MDDIHVNITGIGDDGILDVCRCNDMSAKDYSPAYAIYNLIVAMIVLPAVALFGLSSNLANISIFSRPSFIASPSNIFLLALSCSDFFTVLTGLFLFCSDSARVYIPALTGIATEGVIWILPLGYVAQTCSVYFTLAAAVDCYAKVCTRRPKSTGIPLSCTTAGAKSAVFVVAVFSLAYNSPRFWQFELHQCHDDQANSTNTEVCPTVLYHDIEVVYNVYMYMILMTALPFISLSALNVLIMRNVQKKRAKFSRLRRGGDGSIEPFARNSLVNVCSQAREATGSDDGVITMIMVVVMFLACNTLALVVNIVETFFEPDVLVVQFMTDTSNLLVVFNSSVNFVIYILFDKAYASEFARLFCGKRPGAVMVMDENFNSEVTDDSNYEFTKNRYGAEYQVPQELAVRHSIALDIEAKRRHLRGGRHLSLPMWQHTNKYKNGECMRDATMEQLVNGTVEKVDV